MHAVKYVPEPVRSLRQLESVHDNVFWRGAAPRLSVCIPCFGRDVSPLVESLAKCAASGLVEIIVCEDGGDNDRLADMQHAAGGVRAAVRIVSAAYRIDHVAVRSAAMRHARSDWILLLDAGTVLNDTDFIETYLDAIEACAGPGVIVGNSAANVAAHRDVLENCSTGESVAGWVERVQGRVPVIRIDQPAPDVAGAV